MRSLQFFFLAIYALVMAIVGLEIQSMTDTSADMVSVKLFPTFVFVVGCAFGALELFRLIRAKGSSGEESLPALLAKAFSTRRSGLLILFVAYLLTIGTIGFLVASFAFTFLTILFLAPEKNLRTVLIATAIAVITNLAIYGLLVVYLEAFLP